MDVRRAVAAVLLLGLLGGCSEDEPGADPPEPTSSVSTPPTPPVATDESHEPTAAGARAFVRYWIASFNYAMQTGDTTDFRRLYADSCASCEDISQLIEKIYEPGGRVESEGWVIRDFIRTSMAGGSEASVKTRVTLNPQSIHWAGRDKVDRRIGGEGTATFSMTRTRGEWLVINVVQEAK